LLEWSVAVLNYEDAGNKFNEIILENEESRVLNDVVDFLYKNFDKYSWVGIYIVRGDTLVLGPWKGKQATEHIQIPIGSGVCGSAVKSGKTELVPDVNKDDRYLACFVSTRSEIVVPIKRKGKVIGEIDIDSDVPNAFNSKDANFLEKIASNEKFIGYVDKW
jgi:L-methionine (R)-S-oxide reductase